MAPNELPPPPSPPEPAADVAARLHAGITEALTETVDGFVRRLGDDAAAVADALPELAHEVRVAGSKVLADIERRVAGKPDPAKIVTPALRTGLTGALVETVDTFVRRLSEEAGEAIASLPQWQQDVKAAGAKLLSDDAGQRDVGAFALKNLALQADARALAARLGVKAAALAAVRGPLQAVESVLGTIASIAALAF